MTMPELSQSDHDLLIEIKTIVKTQSESQEKILSGLASVDARVTTLEVNRKGDSEKFHTISEQMQRTLNNADRITQAFTEIAAVKAQADSQISLLRLEIKNLQDDIGELKKKSNIFDWINFIVTAVVGAVVYFFSGRTP